MSVINKEILENIVNNKTRGQLKLRLGDLIDSDCLCRNVDIKNAKPYRINKSDGSSLAIDENGRVYYSIEHSWDIVDFIEEKYLEYPEKPSCEKTQEEKVEEILETFNFGQVADVMEFLKWEWYSTQGVPNINEITEFAEELINECISNLKENTNEENKIISSGGFRASAYRNPDRPDVFDLSLEFILTDSATF